MVTAVMVQANRYIWVLIVGGCDEVECVHRCVCTCVMEEVDVVMRRFGVVSCDCVVLLACLGLGVVFDANVAGIE